MRVRGTRHVIGSIRRQAPPGDNKEVPKVNLLEAGIANASASQTSIKKSPSTSTSSTSVIASSSSSSPTTDKPSLPVSSNAASSVASSSVPASLSKSADVRSSISTPSASSTSSAIASSRTSASSITASDSNPLLLSTSYTTETISGAQPFASSSGSGAGLDASRATDGKIGIFPKNTFTIVVSACGAVAVLLSLLLCIFCTRRIRRNRQAVKDIVFESDTNAILGSSISEKSSQRSQNSHPPGPWIPDRDLRRPVSWEQGDDLIAPQYHGEHGRPMPSQSQDRAGRGAANVVAVGGMRAFPLSELGAPAMAPAPVMRKGDWQAAKQIRMVGDVTEEGWVSGNIGGRPMSPPMALTVAHPAVVVREPMQVGGSRYREAMSARRNGNREANGGLQVNPDAYRSDLTSIEFKSRPPGFDATTLPRPEPQSFKGPATILSSVSEEDSASELAGSIYGGATFDSSPRSLSTYSFRSEQARASSVWSGQIDPNLMRNMLGGPPMPTNPQQPTKRSLSSMATTPKYSEESVVPRARYNGLVLPR